MEAARIAEGLTIKQAMKLLGLSRSSYYRQVRGMKDYRGPRRQAPSVQHREALREVALKRVEAGHRRVRAYAVRTGLAGHTRNSITEISLLERELARVRQTAIARDNEELELGVRCMAAGIYDDQDRLVAGLSISAPADRLEEGWTERLRTTAAAISSSLGRHEAS